MKPTHHGKHTKGLGDSIDQMPAAKSKKVKIIIVFTENKYRTCLVCSKWNNNPTDGKSFDEHDKIN